MIRGDDVIIDELAVIKYPELLTTGDHVAIDNFVYVSTRLTVGDWVHIAPFSSIIGGKTAHLVMGNLCALAAGARMICASDDWDKAILCSFLPKEYRTVINKPIIMGDYTGVATNAIVMPGVHMARGSIVGANSVLTKDTVEWGMYWGTPARLIRMRNKEHILEIAKKMGYEL